MNPLKRTNISTEGVGKGAPTNMGNSMDCTQAIAILIQQATEHNVDEAVWLSAQDHIAQCQACLEVLARLHQALAEPDWDLLAKAGPLLSCDEVSEDLPVYVEADLAGEDVQEVSPLIWHHLQACPRCQEQALLLREMVLAERRGELPPLPAPPSTRLHRESPPFVIHITPSCIRQLLEPSREEALVFRGEDTLSPEGRMIYRDVVDEGAEERIVTVRLYPQKPPSEGWRLEVRIVGEKPVVDLPVIFSRGEERYASVTDETGVAAMEDLPPSWLDLDREDSIQVYLG